MAEVGQDHPVTEPAAVEGPSSPPAEAASQAGVPPTQIRRVALNISLSLLIAIGIALLNNIPTFAKVLFSAASLCSVLITWFLSLYDKDLKKDFKEEARNFLESRSYTWSLALPVVAVWAVNAYFAGFFGWTENRINGEPVVLRVVPTKDVFQILDGAGAGNGEPIKLRLHYRGKSTDYSLKGAGVIYMGSSKEKLHAQFETSDENLQKKLKEYLTKEGVPKENQDQWLTEWDSSHQYLDTPVFRAGEEVGIDLVCPDSKDSNKIMVRKPDFHLTRDQDPVYLESLEEHNPCVPPG